MMYRVTVIVAILALTGGVTLGQAPSPIRGAWRVVEVTTTGPKASTNTTPQPGLFIFTEKHYSIMRDTARETRPSISAPANITAADALAVFGPFMAQAGTYDVTGSTLRGTPLVSKIPPPQGKYGRSNSWSVRLHADTLWLTQLDGASQRVTDTAAALTNPTTIKLIRVE